MIDPEDLRRTLTGVLRRGGVPLAARAPLGLEALRGEPVHARRRPRRHDRLRAGRVDHEHVRRQLELAWADLDAPQLPRDPPVRRSTSGSSATTSSSSTPPARGRSTRSGRSRRTSPTGSSRSGCPVPTAVGRSTGRPRGSRTDPAWKDNLTFNEYFHGDNGAGLGATHQTGWTALVADLILDPPRVGPARADDLGHPPALSEAVPLGR